MLALPLPLPLPQDPLFLLRSPAAFNGRRHLKSIGRYSVLTAAVPSKTSVQTDVGNKHTHTGTHTHTLSPTSSLIHTVLYIFTVSLVYIHHQAPTTTAVP